MCTSLEMLVTDACLRVKTRAGESEGGILMRTVRGGWEQGNAEDGIVPVACSSCLSSAGTVGILAVGCDCQLSIRHVLSACWFLFLSFSELKQLNPTLCTKAFKTPRYGKLWKPSMRKILPNDYRYNVGKGHRGKNCRGSSVRLLRQAPSPEYVSFWLYISVLCFN